MSFVEETRRGHTVYENTTVKRLNDNATHSDESFVTHAVFGAASIYLVVCDTSPRHTGAGRSPAHGLLYHHPSSELI